MGDGPDEVLDHLVVKYKPPMPPSDGIINCTLGEGVALYSGFDVILGDEKGIPSASVVHKSAYWPNCGQHGV